MTQASVNIRGQAKHGKIRSRINQTNPLISLVSDVCFYTFVARLANKRQHKFKAQIRDLHQHTSDGCEKLVLGILFFYSGQPTALHCKNIGLSTKLFSLAPPGAQEVAM